MDLFDINELCTLKPEPVAPWSADTNDIQCRQLMYGQYILIKRMIPDQAKLYVGDPLIHFRQKRKLFGG